jgi:hypothetical protein
MVKREKIDWSKILGKNLKTFILAEAAKGGTITSIYTKILENDAVKEYIMTVPINSSEIRKRIKESVDARFSEYKSKQKKNGY